MTGARAAWPPDSPLVTVVVPTFNRRELVLQAVDSVLAQSWTELELVVVDDGSTDGTVEALEQVGDPRLRVSSSGWSGNISALRNRGAQLSRGDWIAFLDSDDLWERDKLQRQLGALRKTGASWSYTATGLIDGEGRAISGQVGAFRAISGNALEALVRDETGAGISTLVIDRKLFESLGGFDEGLPTYEDLDLQLRLASAAEAVALSDVLVRVREHHGRRTHAKAFPHEQCAVVFARLARGAESPSVARLARRRCAAHLRAAAAMRLRSGHLVRGARLLARALWMRR